MNWKSDTVWDSISELTEVTGVEWPGLLLHASASVLVDMNEQDMNEWTGGCCCGAGYL